MLVNVVMVRVTKMMVMVMRRMMVIISGLSLLLRVVELN